MYTLKQLLGKRIKELRLERNLTQEQLAELVDIGAASLSKIEIGMYHPTGENLEKIANALNVEPYELYIFNHHKDTTDLRSDIDAMIKKADEKDIKLIYKILKSILV